MINNSLDTPVIYLIFNRPDLTIDSFSMIRDVKPKKLLVIADGPRHEAENETCQKTRQVIKSIDWDCELLTNYSDINLGCKMRVSSGISWAFEQVEEAIILEDDCLPHHSFFPYCETMLSRYRETQQVMHISGSNFQNRKIRGRGSYYFSKYAHIWGWATWRRAWQHYDVQVNSWPSFKLSNQFHNWCFNQEEKTFWINVFDSVYSGKLDTWDYQWLLAIIRQKGLCLMPNCNLVSNQGFRSDATHTKLTNQDLANMSTYEYQLPDRITRVAVNKMADMYTFSNHVLSSQSEYSRGIANIKDKLRAIYKSLRYKFIF